MGSTQGNLVESVVWCEKEHKPAEEIRTDTLGAVVSTWMLQFRENPVRSATKRR